MGYHNENYWAFGLSPSSGTLGNRKHDVSETGSVSVLRCGGKNRTQLPLLRVGLFTELLPGNALIKSVTIYRRVAEFGPAPRLGHLVF
jgi:hypothetical protein